MKFELKIGEESYSIPEYYTLGQWARMSQWNMQDPNDWPFLLANALGIKDAKILLELKSEDEKKFNFILSIVLSALDLNVGKYREEIQGYKMISLEKMTVGTWIDLDVMASDNKRQDELLARLYEMPLETARELNVNWVYPSLKLYANFRKSVYRSYSALFEYKDNNEGEDLLLGNKSMTPAHAWYETLMVLCGGNFRDIEYVVKRPFKEAFNFLAWKKTKMLEEQMELNKQKQKMKIK